MPDDFGCTSTMLTSVQTQKQDTQCQKHQVVHRYNGKEPLLLFNVNLYASNTRHWFGLTYPRKASSAQFKEQELGDPPLHVERFQLSLSKSTSAQLQRT